MERGPREEVGRRKRARARARARAEPLPAAARAPEGAPAFPRPSAHLHDPRPDRGKVQHRFGLHRAGLLLLLLPPPPLLLGPSAPTLSQRRWSGRRRRASSGVRWLGASAHRRLAEVTLPRAAEGSGRAQGRASWCVSGANGRVGATRGGRTARQAWARVRGRRLGGCRAAAHRALCRPPISLCTFSALRRPVAAASCAPPALLDGRPHLTRNTERVYFPFF
jgi:hypothetical protein